MQLKTHSRFGHLLKTFGIVAIATIASQSAQADSSAADGFVAKGAVTVGEAGPALTLTIDVAKEFHWNQEYPAKFEVIGDLPAGVAVPQPIVKAKDGGIKATAQKATTMIPFTRTAQAKGPVTVQARFSICNDRVCLMKSARVEVDVGAK